MDCNVCVETLEKQWDEEEQEDGKEIFSIDLNYVVIDIEIVKHHIDSYEKTKRIVDFFAELVGSDAKYSHLIREEYLLNKYEILPRSNNSGVISFLRFSFSNGFLDLAPGKSNKSVFFKKIFK